MVLGLQILGRFECAVASAPAPSGLMIISPPTLTLVFSEPAGRLQNFGPERQTCHCSTCADGAAET